MAQLDRPVTASDWLSPVLALEDPIGVLSVYVDADPTLAAGTPPAWQTPIRAGLRDLVRVAQLDWPRADRMALEQRLKELEPELASLLDRRDLSRGRALFAGIEHGDVRQIVIHAVLPATVVFGRRAVVLPLVAARQAGGPAGVAELSWTRVVLSEWELGVLEELERIDLDVDLGGEPGRPATHPSVPQPFPERDRFATAVGSRVLARLREAGAELGRDARARGWETVVVDGESRFVEAFQDGIGAGGPAVLASARSLAGVSRAEAADRVGAALHERRTNVQRELAERLDASASATRDAAVVERALAEGRVEHLLLEAATERPTLGTAETFLRQALETGARVTVVEEASAAVGPDGVAAILRW
jgi:hypothetical protein